METDKERERERQRKELQDVITEFRWLIMCGYMTDEVFKRGIRVMGTAILEMWGMEEVKHFVAGINTLVADNSQRAV